ncbi:hypothetical protein D3C78_1253290 [compost metagenome]
MLATCIQAFLQQPLTYPACVLGIGSSRLGIFPVDMQAAIGPVHEPETGCISIRRPMFNPVEAAFDSWQVTRHRVGRAQVQAVVAIDSGWTSAVFGQPDHAAGTDDLVIIVIGGYALAGASRHTRQRQPPADTEHAVAG